MSCGKHNLDKVHFISVQDNFSGFSTGKKIDEREKFFKSTEYNTRKAT